MLPKKKGNIEPASGVLQPGEKPKDFLVRAELKPPQQIDHGTWQCGRPRMQDLRAYLKKVSAFATK